MLTGKQTKLFRQKYSLTQDDLGDYLGCGQSKVCGVERGRIVSWNENESTKLEELFHGGFNKELFEQRVQEVKERRRNRPWNHFWW